MVYIIGQLHKRQRKDGTRVEYGPYYWLVENQWTPRGPRLKKLQYLGKHPPQDLLAQYPEVPQELTPFFGFFQVGESCNHCEHSEVCQVSVRPPPLEEAELSETGE